MTPAIDTAKKAGIHFRIHEYSHDPAAASYGEEAATALDIDSARVFKTLLVAAAGPRVQLAVAIVPVSGLLNLKQMARALGVKKVEMADAKEAERSSGYVVGGISPLGQKRLLPTVLDESALQFDTVFVSAGKRGLEIELAPRDLLALTRGSAAAIGAAH